MTEEMLNALRQADVNLRDALERDAEERPQVSVSLNDRLMQRVTQEKPHKTRIRTIWPWIAAACVAGVLVIWLTPPKEDATDVVAENTVIKQPVINNKVEEPLVVQVEMEAEKPAKTFTKAKKASVQKETPSQNILVTPTPQTEEINHDLAAVESAELQEKPVTLSEYDVPITRPENLKYTPEELALMKKQANEAYLKWVELELEIAKYNLGQTAQQ